MQVVWVLQKEELLEWKGRVAPLGMNIALRCWDQTVLAASFLFAVLLVLLLFLEMKLQHLHRLPETMLSVAWMSTALSG